MRKREGDFLTSQGKKRKKEGVATVGRFREARCAATRERNSSVDRPLRQKCRGFWTPLRDSAGTRHARSAGLAMIEQLLKRKIHVNVFAVGVDPDGLSSFHDGYLELERLDHLADEGAITWHR